MSKSKFSSFLRTNRVLITFIIAICLAFFAGLVIPSPFFKPRGVMSGFYSQGPEIKDTTNMLLSDGSVYEGSINSKTNVFQGYGVLSKGESIYEGNWKNGKLHYGKRTTPQSIYEGRFDKDLNNHGFGIITYTPKYIEGKKRQGKKDSEIIAVYAGNWKKNVKSGLGRSQMADNSLEFGIYEEGLLKKNSKAKYRHGEKVYGIDVSRHQDDINWDQLALYCDEKGNVFSGGPKNKEYMQPVLFAYMKATEGATVVDPTYEIRSVEASRHGIRKGAYHFLRLGSSVDDQVKNFIETAKWEPGDLPPALDVEVEAEIKAHGEKKFLDTTYKWLTSVEKEMNVCPIIYTTEHIRDKYLKKDPRFSKYKYWIARYHPDGPKKKEWLIWQMTEKGKMNGYKGDIDINLFQGNYNSFIKQL